MGEYDYRGIHRPAEGVGAHEIDRVFPEDVYHHLTDGWYSGYQHRETAAQLRAARGNPEHMLTIYRALPHPHRAINRGDWVSLAGRYAIEHGRHATDPSQDMPVVKAKVPAKLVHSDGNDLQEFSYQGHSIPAAEVHWSPDE